MRRSSSSLLFLLAFVSGAHAQNPRLIAPTDALTPAEQRAKFHLPPGFEIQLVVAEPVIGQPMNLNFDAAGRLWITSSLEYPYPAKGEGVQPRDARMGKPGDHEPRDRVVVVEGIGLDGTPERVRVFADGFNIPIGIVPTENGTIVYGIPAIERHRDSNGDGRADATTRLFDGFGNVDTHGMNNGFTRWIDGWIYACHGFRNTSRVRMVAKPGKPVAFEMNSGNTYRFKEDGSAIEQITWGQVNPFGLTFDEYGHAYTGDCHSMPLTALLRGAYYSSFGKPHDGLGYGPNMIDHNHGSTGICGPAYYAADHFPPDYRDNLFLCNPVTGRIHRDKLDDRGSTRFVDSQPDFLTCDDGWFRPVDCQVGPDGCLYVADFYNAIIGHYEVPLNNPKRDRSHGRVWRIVYRGEDGNVRQPSLPRLEQLELDALLERMGSPNIVVRTLATNLVVDRNAPGTVEATMRLVAGDSSPEQRAHGLWVLERIDGLDDALVERLANDVSPLVRTHLVRALAERAEWSPRVALLLRGMLSEADPFVRRAAAEALGRHPGYENIEPLLGLLRSVPAEDTHLRHVIRIALRNHFRDEDVAPAARRREYAEVDGRELASVLLAVPTEASAELISKLALDGRQPARETLVHLEHVARHGRPEVLEAVVLAQVEAHPANPAFQRDALLAAAAGLRRRGATPSPRLRMFVAELALRFLGDDGRSLNWTTTGKAGAGFAWTVEQRRSADGRDGSYFGTLPRGERATGTQRSDAFELPETLSFFVAGHCGPPDQPCHGRNLVRLRDAETGVVLHSTPAPRNDVAQRVEWKLGEHTGRRGFVELVDADAGGAYAWLSVGRFSLNALNPVTFSPRDAAVELIDAFDVEESRPELLAVLSGTESSDATRAAAARALLALAPDARLQAILDVATNPRTPSTSREQYLAVVRTRAPEDIAKSLETATRQLPGSEQSAFVETLAGDRAGGEALLRLVERGRLSPRLLRPSDLLQRLLAVRVPDAERRIDKLTRDLPDVDAGIAAAISAHRRSFVERNPSSERGRIVFEKTCAACHQIGGKGAVVGPQLDGVGIRGLDRLLEDVLDPNRNVDAAFRTTTLVLSSGKVKSGLLRREEGVTLVLADQKGREFTVAKDEIDERVASPLSLMPANLHEVLKPAEIDDLLAYLLRQRRQVR